MDKLLELAERCEKAAGPDRRIDAQIEIVANATKPWIVGEKPGPWPRDPIYGTLADFWEWATDESKEPPEINAARYTASIDTAMTLVPEGWAVRELSDWTATDGIDRSHWGVDLRRLDRQHHVAQSEATTAALALCAAALRARTIQGSSTDVG